MSRQDQPAQPGVAPQGVAQAPLDVFISYAREDRERAQWLATALLAAGQTVWWDRQLAGGQDFGDAIAEHLTAARLVLVLWSRASVTSNFVRDESARARDAGKLLPVRIEDVALPLGFGTLHTLDLLDWDGDSEDPAFAELLANVRRGAAELPGGRGVVPQRFTTRWRKPLLALGMLVALLAGTSFGWHTWREQQARSELDNGLRAQFARDRNLEVARNAYLNALRIDPELGRAHYYLANVYALLVPPGDVRGEFAAALRFAADLDPGQRNDARQQLALLKTADEAAPVTRDARSAPAANKVAHAERPAAPATVSPPHAGVAEPAPSSMPRPAPSRPPVGVVALARPTPVAITQPPRVAPSADQQRQIETQVDAMFAAQAQTRLSAATTVALKPETLSDVLPLALKSALSGLSDKPGDEAAAGGATNTLQLLLRASPATLNANHAAVLQLLDAVQPLGENQRATAKQARTLLAKAEAAARPVAYIQIADEAQRKLASGLAQRIRAAGYEVPGIELVGARAPSHSEVRVQGASIQGWGRWLQKIVGETTDEPTRLNTLRAAKPALDTYEIWLDKALCVQRQVPAC